MGTGVLPSRWSPHALGLPEKPALVSKANPNKAGGGSVLHSCSWYELGPVQDACNAGCRFEGGRWEVLGVWIMLRRSQKQTICKPATLLV
jgi:hypothetical protein